MPTCDFNETSIDNFHLVLGEKLSSQYLMVALQIVAYQKSLFNTCQISPHINTRSPYIVNMGCPRHLDGGGVG